MKLKLVRAFSGYMNFIVKDKYIIDLLDGKFRCSCADEYKRKYDPYDGTNKCKHITFIKNNINIIVKEYNLTLKQNDKI